jgi:hypothetical protein
MSVWLSLSDVIMSMLRPQTTVDFIPHPYHIYRKCFFSILICYEWAYGCALRLLHLWRAGWIFGNGGRTKPE